MTSPLSSPLTVIEPQRHTQQVSSYQNVPLSVDNDHLVRLSVMTEPYPWHHHPNSDEVFLGVEGILCIGLEGRPVELAPGQLFTIPANVWHRTRPQGSRSVNLTPLSWRK